MRTSKYLILITFVLILVVPVARFFTINPDVNACMIEYVDSFDESNGWWFIYKIDWVNHIEPENSIFNKYIADHKVWYSQWCVMISGDLFTDFNNSVYCSLTYIVKKVTNQYTEEPEQPMIERIRVLKSKKSEFATTAKQDFTEAEDIFLEAFVSGIDNVRFSLTILDDKLLGLFSES